MSAVKGVKATEMLIAGPMDCVAAQQFVRHMALALGFSGTASEEIVLAVAELSSNLIKHAGRGKLTFRPLETGECIGIEVQAEDRGPGIGDVERSFADGYSTSGSLGYGLGTVNRMMDELDIRSMPACGTWIACRRWIRPVQLETSRGLWDFSVFTRSRKDAPENGDAFVVMEWQDQLLAGLIDGLGHGESAQKAALAAQGYVQTHYDQPLERIFLGVSRACRATRGVVLALARFVSPTQLLFASIGNIEVRSWSRTERLPFVMTRGILGAQETTVRVQELPWKPEWLLVLHTDGLRSHWQWGDFPGIEREPAKHVAQNLMRMLATEHDDATVLAVRSAKP